MEKQKNYDDCLYQISISMFLVELHLDVVIVKLKSQDPKKQNFWTFPHVSHGMNIFMYSHVYGKTFFVPYSLQYL